MDHPSSSKRKFEECWEELYLLTHHDGEIHCLVCHKVLSSKWVQNLKKHYNARRAKEYDILSRDERLHTIERLKEKLIKENENQSEDLIECNAANKHAVLKCSYELALKIAKNRRPFSDGDFIKECFTTTAELLVPNEAEQFRQVSLSRNTVTRRIREMAADVQRQLAAATRKFITFSLALDESTDVTGTPQVAIFVRGVNEKLSIIEELVDFSPLTETTTGADILSCADKAVDGMGLDWTKLVSVTTDGAPAMVGEYPGFVGRLRDGLGNLPVPHKIDNFHCIIHQQNFCAKRIQFEDVMSVVIQMTNYIRMNVLKRRQFGTFLEDLECDYCELPLHTDVRWLSRGKDLDRFFHLRDELLVFLDMVNHDVPQLQDKKWLCNLAFPR